MARMQDTWDQGMFGLRLPHFGTPQAVVTTTPRPLKLIRDLLRRPKTYVVRGGTFENSANLSEATLTELRVRYENTRLGRQELYGEVLDDVLGALWDADLIARQRLRTSGSPDDPLRDTYEVQPLDRVVVAFDPSVAAEGSENMAETGVVAGVMTYNCPCGTSSRRSPHVIVLEDASLRAGPVRWGQRGVACMRTWGSNEAIGEVNNGGDLVRLNIKAAWDRDTATRALKYTAVRASTSKKTRAEPVAALYEQGRVHHLGVHEELEHQMTTWVPPEERDEEHELVEDGFTGSPDRVDALVWLVTALLIDPEPQRRGGLSVH